MPDKLRLLMPADITRWKNRALWTLKDTVFLLHGYEPHNRIDPSQDTDLKTTYDELRISIRARELDQEINSELSRDQVMTWAAQRRELYPKFPFTDPQVAAQTARDFVDQFHKAGIATQTMQLSLQLSHLRNVAEKAEHERDALKVEVERLNRELTEARVAPAKEPPSAEKAQPARWPWGEYTTPALETIARVGCAHFGPTGNRKAPRAKDFSKHGLTNPEDRDAKTLAAIFNQGSALNGKIRPGATNKSRS